MKAQSDFKNQILVVGAGGLGSETIKILKERHFDITIIDFDIVETSNLNRQFYFTLEDRGKFKSEVIGRKNKCKYIISRIENLESSFLDQFHIIFSCLDNVSSRIELNYKFFHSKSKILIDSGVENMEFHVKRVDKESSCL